MTVTYLAPARFAADFQRELTAAAVIGVDRRGRTVVWNRGAELLFGWGVADVLGRLPPCVPRALRQEWRLQLREVLDGGRSTLAAETQRITRDGQVVPVLRASEPLVDPDGALVGVLDTLIDITEHRRLDDEGRALAQLRERDTIVMDLHDGLVQQLYGVVLGLSTHAEGDALARVRGQLEGIIDETRRYLFDLRARELLPHSLAAGLRLLVDSLRINGRLDVSLRLDASADARLEREVRGQLLYLAREACSNIMRHARASSAVIALELAPECVVLTVSDDGRGFDVATKEPVLHYGLRNMRSRARLAGGSIHIESALGAGTRVRVEVPLRDPAADDQA